MAHHEHKSSIKDWLFTTDHKKIGMLYFVTSFVFFIMAGLAALAIRAHLATPTGAGGCDTSVTGAVMSCQMYNELFSIHGVAMIFLWIIPVLIGGFGNYFIPILIGAKDLVFPRLNALSYWTYLAAGIILWSGFMLAPFFPATVQTQAAVGWTGYPPLSEAKYTPGFGVTLWTLGIQLVGVSSMMGAINFIVTILRERAPGVTFDNMSLFLWAQFITAVLIVFATPLIGMAVTGLYFDRMWGTSFFLPSQGGDALLYQHLFWFYSHPAVYVMILPAMGIISEIIPNVVGRPIFGYRAIAYSTAAIAFLGFIVWMHHMFATGVDVRVRMGFMMTTMVIGVPTGVKIFNWVASLWGGKITFNAPTLFTLGFISMFLIGGIDGVFMASIPVDYDLHMTYWVVAHIHYVLFGGSVLGAFAGIYYWFPRMTGRMFNEKLAQWHFWLSMIGLNVVFMTMHFVGAAGMPRRTYDYLPEYAGMNMLATVGAFILAIGQIPFFVNMWLSRRVGRASPPEPWLPKERAVKQAKAATAPPAGK